MEQEEVLVVDASYKYLSNGVFIMKKSVASEHKLGWLCLETKHKGEFMSFPEMKRKAKIVEPYISWVYGSEGHSVKKFGDSVYIKGIVKPTGEHLKRINELRAEIKAKNEELNNYLKDNLSSFDYLDLKTAEEFSRKPENYEQKKEQVFKELGWSK